MGTVPIYYAAQYPQFSTGRVSLGLAAIPPNAEASVNHQIETNSFSDRAIYPESIQSSTSHFTTLTWIRPFEELGKNAVSWFNCRV